MAWRLGLFRGLRRFRLTSEGSGCGFHLRKGYRGRLANDVAPVPEILEALGRVELEHAARNNRVRVRV